MKRRKITIGTVRFVLRKEKETAEGLIPVFLKYSFQGKALFYSIGKSLLIHNWDEESKEPIYVSKPIAKKLAPDIKYSQFLSNSEVQDIISQFNELELEIKSIESKLVNFTSQDVIRELRGEQKPADPVEKGVYFDDWVKSIADENKEKMKHSTWKVYNTINQMILDYERSMVKRHLLKEIDYTYIKGICLLMNKKGLLNSTISKRLRHIKGFLKSAVRHGLEVDPTYQNYSWVENELDVIALTLEELNRIEQLDLSGNARLERVRDVFLFACYTGLRYSDFSKLRTEHVKGNFLKFTSTKTKSLQVIPLIERSRLLIQKYKSDDNDHLFPVPSGQKFNQFVKEVCVLSEIDEPIEKVRYSGSKQIIEVKPKHELISAHTARRTFVTLSLELGMKAEEVMNITGHKSYQSFKKYVKITEKRAKDALLSAWDK